MQTRAATILTLILLAALILVACVPVPAPVTSQPVAAAPTATVPSAPSGSALHPPIAEVCNGMAQTMMQALNTEVTQSEVAMTDPTTGTSGTACRAMTTGTGEQFTSPDVTLQALSAVLTSSGWQEDMNLAANGPTGVGTGFRSRDLVCLAVAQWKPDASANCPTDKPISACKVTPEQQIYTVTLDCAQTAAQDAAALPNPASQNCITQGGKLAIEARGDGGQFGVCFFEDNRQCEEWAQFRGECPVGGVKITGYVTPAARYCAITGSSYTITGNSGESDEQGTCMLPNGGQCDAWAYYNGTCDANSAALPTDSTATAATTGMTYSDPFAYCAAVGTMDAPDEQYTGPAVPDAVAQGLRTAMETPDAPAELFAEGRAFWRCMDSRVYGCVVGANIPCTETADLSQEPSPEMVEFCQQNQGAEVIPASVTGRATIYVWRCENSTPVAGEPVAEVDARGYNQSFWYELPVP